MGGPVKLDARQNAVRQVSRFGVWCYNAQAHTRAGLEVAGQLDRKGADLPNDRQQDRFGHDLE